MENYRKYKNTSVPPSYHENDPSNQEDDGEEEIQSLKNQIRGVKQDSAAATRHAISKLAESEDIASSTVQKLGVQSEKINQIDRRMEEADARADEALDKSKELKRINNSMFSAFSIRNPFKSKSESKKLAELQAKHEAQIKRDDEVRASNQEAQRRVKDTLSSKPNSSSPNPDSGSHQAGGSSQYNFEEDEEGMRLEKEIDGNLDDISGALGRLKNMSLGMGTEIESQNSKLDRINQNATNVESKVHAGTDRLKKIR